MADDLDIPIEEPTPEKKGGGKSLIMILLVACLLGGGVGGFFFWKHSKAKAPAEPKDKVREVLHLEDFVVNLADPDGHSYVRLGVDLGQTEVPKAGKETGPNPVPAIRDTVLTVVAGYKADDLLTLDGKTRLKHELLATLQQHVPEAHVGEVYFTEFLVQR